MRTGIAITIFWIGSNVDQITLTHSHLRLVSQITPGRDKEQTSSRLHNDHDLNQIKSRYSFFNAHVLTSNVFIQVTFNDHYPLHILG